MTKEQLKEIEEKQKDLLWGFAKNLSTDFNRERDFIFWDEAQEVIKAWFETWMPTYSGSTEEILLLQALEEKVMMNDNK